MVVTPAPSETWVADAAGTSHAQRPGRRRALCGLPALDVRLAAAVRVFCDRCLDAIAIEAFAPDVEVFPIGELLDEIALRAPAYHEERAS